MYITYVRSEGLSQFITSGDCKEPGEKEHTIDPSPEGVIVLLFVIFNPLDNPPRVFLTWIMDMS